METKRITRKVLMLAAGIFMFTSVTFSQTVTDPAAPHGGRIKAAGNYFVELLFSSEKTYVYLLDQKVKPVSNQGISGKIIFQQADNIVTASELIPLKEEGFIAKVSVPAYVSCTVNFEVRGKKISAAFDNAESIAERNTK